MPFVNVKTALLCDDIRIEIIGKYILIGVYPWNLIAVKNLQLPVGFSCYVEMETDMRGPVTGQARIINAREEVLHVEGLSLTLLPTGLNFTHFWAMSFIANSPGDFRFQWQFGAANWVDITTIKIVHYVPPTQTPLST